MAEIVLIAAVAEGNRVIGREMELPWHIPADLKRFKRLTTGHPLVMGRRTFESLLQQFGGPLPGRESIVLTRDPTAAARLSQMDASVSTCGSLEEALENFRDRERIFIGGGASIYAAVLDESEAPPLADRLELTIVEGSFEGDTFFPPYEHLLGSRFHLVHREAHAAEGRVPEFRFDTWLRNV